MRKYLFAVAVMLGGLFLHANADAQICNNRGLGITGGLTTSVVGLDEFKTESVSQCHIGLVYKIPLIMGFAVQPGITYNVKGTKLGEVKSKNYLSTYVDKINTKIGYFEIPVQLQWGPDLLVFRPYLFAEPFIGFRIHDNTKVKANPDLNNAKDVSDKVGNKFEKKIKKFEYGFALGAGIEFWRLQGSLKYFWNFGNIYGNSNDHDKLKERHDVYADNVIKAVNNGSNFHGIQFSLTYLF